MSRIRTVKPALFLHDQLYDLEIETGLPIRVAFIGLFTQADREGRFEWRPRRLKAAILPYDDVDFSRVLHALATRGFLVMYASKGREIGWIPTFKKHQVINNRESASELPPPPDEAVQAIENGELLTRAPRVDDACPTRTVHAQAEGKGREGKLNKTLGRNPKSGLPSDWEKHFDEFKSTYPSRGKATNPVKPAREKFAKLIRDGTDPDQIIAGTRGYSVAMKDLGHAGTERVKQMVTFLNQACWEQYQPGARPNGGNGAAPGPPRTWERAHKEAEYQAQFPGGEGDQVTANEIMGLVAVGDLASADKLGADYLDRRKGAA